VKRLAVVFFAVAVYVSALDPDSLTTGGLYNGRGWVTANSGEKLYFVMAFGDALIVETKVSGVYFGESTNGEIVKGLDQFYEDPANASIPVPFAMKLFARKVSGASAEDLAARTAELRRNAKAASQNAPDAK
jgi:hypothetical protein